MSGSLIPNGKQQYLDANGAPLAGGKVYYYIPYTTTAKNTWQDINLTILNTNPIILDSAGECIAWGSGAYRQQIYDVNDNLIWDQYTYGISPAGSNFISQEEVQTATQGQVVFTLATITYVPGINSLVVFVNGSKQVTGTNYTETAGNTVTFVTGLNAGDVVDFYASLPATAQNMSNAITVAYNPPYSGSVSTNVQVKLAQTVSVKDFGADPTGTNDSTSAFVNALAIGGRVYVPTGNYKITSNIVVSANTYLYGDGPFKSILQCNTNTYTGIFVTVRGRTNIQDIGINATGVVAGTGMRIFDSGGEYSFTGNINLKNVYVNGFTKGIDVNNIFNLMLEQCEVSGNAYGINIVPSYNASFDSGYVTTITIFKSYVHNNSTYGIYAASTIISRNIHILDTIVEANTGATAQIYVSKCNPLLVTNCYQELVPASPAILFDQCNAYVRGLNCNGTGGISLGSSANDICLQDYYGGQSTDIIYANGTSIQTLRVENSTVAGTSTLNASKLSFINSQINGTLYKQYNSNLGLSITDGDLTNTSRIDSIIALKRTVTATISANTTTALIADQYLPNTWNSDFTTAMANFLDSYNAGLILTVQCATTNGSQYFNVLATNTTGSTITITSKALRILFFKGTAMAI